MARFRCNIFLKGTVSPESNNAEMGPQASYTLRRNIASTMTEEEKINKQTILFLVKLLHCSALERNSYFSNTIEQ